MSGQIYLSESEKARLERLLTIEDLESQKRIAYPFWALAGITFLTSQVALLWNPIVYITLLPMAFAKLMIGMARFGYYRLYRLIHHLNAAIDETSHSV